jgi:hypothetical protein
MELLLRLATTILLGLINSRKDHCKLELLIKSIEEKSKDILDGNCGDMKKKIEVYSGIRVHFEV